MSEQYEQAVDELQKRVDMLHVLAGIEVSDVARGYAIGGMQSATATLDRVASEVVQASGLTEDEWQEYHAAERERRGREWKKAERERRARPK